MIAELVSAALVYELDMEICQGEWQLRQDYE